MTGNYRLTQRAAADIRGLSVHIKDNLGRHISHSFLHAMSDHLNLISNEPRLGIHQEFIAPSCYGYSHGSYQIYYQDSGDRINVLRVLHLFHEALKLHPDNDWDSWFDSDGVSEDFMLERDQPDAQERDPL